MMKPNWIVSWSAALGLALALAPVAGIAQERLPASLDPYQRYYIRTLPGHVLDWETDSYSQRWRQTNNSLIEQLGKTRRDEQSLIIFEGMDDPRVRPPGWEPNPRMFHPLFRERSEYLNQSR